MFLQEYEKLRLIGKGAFASVYKVRHASLGYVRALKVSHELIESENDKSWQTFLNECCMLLRIGNGAHPNIVRIYQPRLLDNKAAVEMDYVDGMALSEYVAMQRFVLIDECERFARQIVGALAYCHVDIYRFMMDAEADNLQINPADGRKYIVHEDKERELIEKYSVIHNDLHSNNIIRRDYDGQYILLDFGLAIQDDHCVKSSSRGDGAIEYSAPEKLEENLVSKQSDVYSLGILLYEVLAGTVPFPCKGNTPESARAKVYMQHLTATPPEILPLRRAAFEAVHPGEEYHDDLPAGLTDIVMRCLAKNPAERYGNAKELYEALVHCFEQHDKTVVSPLPDVSELINEEVERRVRQEMENRTYDELQDDSESKGVVWSRIIKVGLIVLAACLCYVMFFHKTEIKKPEDSAADTLAVEDIVGENTSTVAENEVEPIEVEDTLHIVIESAESVKPVSKVSSDLVAPKQKIRADEDVIEPDVVGKPQEDKVFNAVEEPPTFPGGQAAMYEFLKQELRYPQMAAENNIQGRVVVQFVVEKDGSIGEVKVVRSVDLDLDNEAVRFVKAMPKFIPGRMNGQSVRVWFTLPVNFKLKS